MGDEAGLNISEFDGPAVSVPEIINAASSYPFLADRRMVIVKGLLAHITRKGAGETGKQAVQRLLDELPRLPDWTRLVLVEYEPLPDNNRIVALAKESPTGFVKAFSVPEDTTAWIIKRAADEHGVEIEPQAAWALAQVTAKDLHRADNELVKLAAYVNGERPITEADVDLLTPYVAETTAFALVDAMALGKGETAFNLLYRLLSQKDEDPFRLYGMIVRQFRLMLLAKEHLVLNGNRAGLADALGVKPFVANKAADQSRFFDLEQLEEIYRVLQDYDRQIKTGEIKINLALDLIIAGIAR